MSQDNSRLPYSDAGGAVTSERPPYFTDALATEECSPGWLLHGNVQGLLWLTVMLSFHAELHRCQKGAAQMSTPRILAASAQLTATIPRLGCTVTFEDAMLNHSSMLLGSGYTQGPAMYARSHSATSNSAISIGQCTYLPASTLAKAATPRGCRFRTLLGRISGVPRARCRCSYLLQRCITVSKSSVQRHKSYYAVP
jgi:hypothetical protein